jgi:hypothetical protein
MTPKEKQQKSARCVKLVGREDEIWLRLEWTKPDLDHGPTHRLGQHVSQNSAVDSRTYLGDPEYIIDPDTRATHINSSIWT